MTLTFRHRILLTLVPLFALLAVLGGAGVVLLFHLEGRIDRILREDYDSILAMDRLNEALERIDSSFHFALEGNEQAARQQYEENWKHYRARLRQEQINITVPGEAELVERLTALTDHYQRQGDDFLAAPAGPKRKAAYFGEEGRPGLLATFTEIKDVTSQILSFNRTNMEQANRDARATARAGCRLV